MNRQNAEKRSTKWVGIVAGEASGDAIAAAVVERLQQQLPGLGVVGVGGERLSATGAEMVCSYTPLALHGYAEALLRLPQLLRLRQRLEELFATADAFIGVDAPDFNLGLAERLRQRGIATAQVVSPAVWAWRPARVERVAKAVELLLCLFPFEPEYYRNKGVRAVYVGHPLADLLPPVADRAAARAALGINEGAVLAVLPGSRVGEWQRHGAIFLAAAERVAMRVGATTVIVPTADEVGDRFAADWAERWEGKGQLVIAPRQAHTALAACDVALVASGTATLEAALLKRPMVIAYRTAGWQYRWLRRQMRVQWIGLPNILCGAEVVPELLQEEATPERLARALLAWWEDPQRVRELEERFMELHEVLRCNMAEGSAALLAEWLKRGER
ncbi:MAG: lipid-A-disaccharide synthase [Hydrogenophilus sp.]|nr:lipid-A-disaccharide synthase [Hydrogenophilus sp.]